MRYKRGQVRRHRGRWVEQQKAKSFVEMKLHSKSKRGHRITFLIFLFDPEFVKQFVKPHFYTNARATLCKN